MTPRMKHDLMTVFNDWDAKEAKIMMLAICSLYQPFSRKRAVEPKFQGKYTQYWSRVFNATPWLEPEALYRELQRNGDDVIARKMMRALI